MKVGIVGFSRAGKTTVFNALTGLHAATGGYADPAKPNLGTIKVPDPRVDWLGGVLRPKKMTHAEMVFVDFPAGVDHAPTALDSTTIAHMRDADALVQVVQAFPDLVTGAAPDPGRAIENFRTELILADLAIVEKRLERLRKQQGQEHERDLLERCRAALDAETPLRRLDLDDADERALSGFGLLSRLPLLVLLNVEEAAAAAPLPEAVRTRLEQDAVGGLALCAQIEMEIAALDPEERGAFLADLGLKEPARDRFIRAAYALLDLISFMTTTHDEVRAWPIRRGATALKAAGKVHSDMERGFIRAEVIAYEDFARYGSEAKCREAGKLRVEGKDYVVRDGDVIHFRFNV